MIVLRAGPRSILLQVEVVPGGLGVAAHGARGVHGAGTRYKDLVLVWEALAIVTEQGQAVLPGDALSPPVAAVADCGPVGGLGLVVDVQDEAEDEYEHAYAVRSGPFCIIS